MPNYVDSISVGMNQIHRMQVDIAEAAHLRHNPVIQVCKAIREYVEEFERALDDEHEIAVRLASFGGELTFHAEKIGFSKPNVITFFGVTEAGEKVQLIQHVSQLSFLLKAVKKRAVTANRIGFIWADLPRAE